jgi:hypothetical protein
MTYLSAFFTVAGEYVCPVVFFAGLFLLAVINSKAQADKKRGKTTSSLLNRLFLCG